MVNMEQLKKSIRKTLKDKTKVELKNIIIQKILEEKTTKKYVMKSKCELCGDDEDLQKHHFHPRCLGGSMGSDNLVTLCHYCHWYLHSNPKFKIHHSKLVKEGMRKASGVGKRGPDKKPRSKRGYYGERQLKPKQNENTAKEANLK